MAKKKKDPSKLKVTSEAKPVTPKDLREKKIQHQINKLPTPKHIFGNEKVTIKLVREKGAEETWQVVENETGKVLLERPTRRAAIKMCRRHLYVITEIKE